MTPDDLIAKIEDLKKDPLVAEAFADLFDLIESDIRHGETRNVDKCLQLFPECSDRYFTQRITDQIIPSLAFACYVNANMQQERKK